MIWVLVLIFVVRVLNLVFSVFWGIWCFRFTCLFEVGLVVLWIFGIFRFGWFVLNLGSSRN